MTEQMSWTSGKTLITGGAGFVGRWFTSKLLELGDEVTVVDNLLDSGGGLQPSDWRIQSKHAAHPNLTFIRDDCREFFRSSSRDWNRVFHLAAVVGGREVIERQPLSVAEDLAIDSDFWRWSSLVGPEEVYHFSSSAAYPVNLQSDLSNPVALEENEITFGSSIGQPDLTYGWAKLTSEYLAHIASRNLESKVITFRPFSGYGEDQSGAYPFPSIIRRALEFSMGEIPEMYVWGSGRQTRDFIHISDIVQIVLKAHPLLRSGEALNLGTGQATSFLSLAELALSVAGTSGEVKTQSSKPEGVQSRYAAIRKMSAIGLAPTVSLRDGVTRAMEYHSIAES